MSESTDIIIARLRAELGNIGIAIAAIREGDDATVLLVHGTANRRRASYSVPHGDLTDQATDALIVDAILNIREQIASNSGTWDEAA